MRITRLGQGVDAARRLQAEAMERTFAALGEFRSIMDLEEVGRARLVATSAVRDAENGHAFLRGAEDVVGVPAELLSGREEGRLSYAGATAGLPEATGEVVVVDIGGGSTEIVTKGQDDVVSVSLDIGCVRLTERFLRGDPPTAPEVAGAVGAVERELDRAVREIPQLARADGASHLIGLAGTVSTLASLELGLTHYDRDRIHGAVLTGDAVGRWCAVLGAERVAERALRAEIPAGRRDVIFGGALVLNEVMTRFGQSECLVSESDILDGLVMSMQPSHRSRPSGQGVE